MKIRIDPVDEAFSKYIRTRDNWTCQRCGAVHDKSSRGLHCAHIFGRGKHATRWDPENAFALCYGCHSFVDQNPDEKYKWYVSIKGQEALDNLRLKSNTTVKYTLFDKLQLRKEFMERRYGFFPKPTK